jgi:hypothetical protein
MNKFEMSQLQDLPEGARVFRSKKDLQAGSKLATPDQWNKGVALLKSGQIVKCIGFGQRWKIAVCG